MVRHPDGVQDVVEPSLVALTLVGLGGDGKCQIV